MPERMDLVKVTAAFLRAHGNDGQVKSVEGFADTDEVYIRRDQAPKEYEESDESATDTTAKDF